MTEWWKPAGVQPADGEKTGMVVPRLTLDPELPAPVQELLRQAEPAQLRAALSSDLTSEWWGLADPLGGRRASWWFGWMLLSAFARSVPMAEAGICAYGLAAAIAVSKRRRRLSALRRIAAVHAHFVLNQELDSDAGELLARAARAVSHVQRSSVQRLDPADKQHNDRRLDSQVWEIADSLRTYSRVAGQGPTQAVSEVVAQALEPRNKVLRISLASIGRRVEALEHYAAQIAEAERRRHELRQLRQLATGTEELLDLLASTARDELAVAEIEGMSDEVAKALDLFNEALQSAQDAAAVALPSPVATSTHPAAPSGGTETP
ncbi:hypothetical protein [Streptomyces sp. NBC_00239]|uniref:hypothetical protein n=1 Tax=Streptomyces sp. NBC_00239 TaxID=2903640 RepID=UPI002E2B6C0D|nr:hypothetical protein [Streptomyces sp. NBC_00239]